MMSQVLSPRPRVIVAILAMLLLTVASSTSLLAQDRATGAVAGVATDPSGGVLPGVTVTITSPAMIQANRIAITDSAGAYRFANLPPGIYTVRFELAGFSTLVREEIEVSSGITQTVAGELSLGVLEETVVVTGGTPLIDVQGVNQRAEFNRETLDETPLGLNTNSLATLIPGAQMSLSSQDVGGSQGEGAVGYGVHGSQANDMEVYQDGANYNSMRSLANKTVSVNPAVIEEVTIGVSGISAESMTSGVQVNLITKSGGNTFSGTAHGNFSRPGLQSDNVTEELEARGVPLPAGMRELYDVSGGFGGPIVRDRIWFFTAARRWVTSQEVPGSFWNATPNTPFYTPDLSQPTYTDSYYQDLRGRLTFLLGQGQLGFTYGQQNTCNCFWGVADGDIDPDAAGHNRYDPNSQTTLTYTHPISNSLLLESSFYRGVLTISRERSGNTTEEAVAIYDEARDFWYGASGQSLGISSSYGPKLNNQNNVKFALSYVTGSHSMKAGVFYRHAWLDNVSIINDAWSWTFNNQVPVEVRLFMSPFREKASQDEIGLFVQDQWTLNRMTLNLGVRFDALNGQIPEQTIEPGRWTDGASFDVLDGTLGWKDISPRLGFSYDVGGDGRTAVKGYLGRYVTLQNLGGLLVETNPVRRIVEAADREWTDLNGDFYPQEEELGPISNENFGLVEESNTTFSEDVTHGWHNRGHNWQFALTLERELWEGARLSANYHRRWFGGFYVEDNLEVTPDDFEPYSITAPVDPRLPGGGGYVVDGLYDVTPEKFGQETILVIPNPDQSQVYNGGDVTMNIRTNSGGMFQGGVSFGRTTENSCFVVDSPQQLYNCDVQPAWNQGNQIKFLVAHPVPVLWDADVSVTYQNIAGPETQATYVASNAEIEPSLGRPLTGTPRRTIDLMEPLQEFDGRVNQVDFRLSKAFTLQGGFVLDVNFDAYNLFNASPVLVQNTRYGGSWLNAQQILGARLFKFGAQVRF